MSGLISIFIMISFALFFKKSKLGLAMRATAFDQQAAQSLGVSIKSFCRCMGYIRNGICRSRSCLWNCKWDFFWYCFYGYKGISCSNFRRFRLSAWSNFGGLVIGLLEHLAHYIDVQFLNIGNLIRIAPFYALIIILMIKPYGFFGTKDIERV